MKARARAREKERDRECARAGQRGRDEKREGEREWRTQRGRRVRVVRETDACAARASPESVWLGRRMVTREPLPNDFEHNEPVHARFWP